MSQDDSREKAVIEEFELLPFKGDQESRDARYVPDAIIVVDGEEVTVELKSKPELRTVKRKKDGTLYYPRKSDVSTARGFGAKKVEDWRRETKIFIFSEYEGTKFDPNNPNFIGHYAITFEDLFPHIEQKVLKPYNEGRVARHNSDGYIGVVDYYNIIRPALEGQGVLTEAQLKALDHTIEVGTSLNDPKFSWKYIEKHGTRIVTRQDLEDFCRKKEKQKIV